MYVFINLSWISFYCVLLSFCRVFLGVPRSEETRRIKQWMCPPLQTALAPSQTLFQPCTARNVCTLVSAFLVHSTPPAEPPLPPPPHSPLQRERERANVNNESDFDMWLDDMRLDGLWLDDVWFDDRLWWLDGWWMDGWWLDGGLVNGWWMDDW